MKCLTVFCIVVFIVLTSSNQEKEQKFSFKGYKLVNVWVRNIEEANFLRSLERTLQVEVLTGINKGKVTILISPDTERIIINEIIEFGLEYDVLPTDVQRLIDDEESKQAKLGKEADYNFRYLNLSEIDKQLTQFENMFPDRVRRYTLEGITEEGRPIWAVKVSASDVGNSKKETIWIETLTHAREFITGSVALGSIYKFASLYGGKGELAGNVTDILKRYDIYFCPVHNPDGYNYAYTIYRFWRKNRRVFKDSACFGVDLNRNWDANFKGEGASIDKCSYIYHGEYPLSEPETKALDTAVVTTNTKAFISLHSYSQMIFVPYSYAKTKPPDYVDLMYIAKRAKYALEAYNGTQYQVGTASDILYAASGASLDHFYMKDIKYSFLYELRPASAEEGGFILPVEQIKPTVDETFLSLVELMKQIHPTDDRIKRVKELSSKYGK